MKEYTYKNAATLSKTLLILIVLGAVLSTVAAASGYLEYSLLLSIQDGADFTEAEIETNDSRQLAIAILQTALAIITAVFFCMWVHRMSRNAHSLENVSLTCTPGWAVGYFFVPVVNFWKPYQALREAYEAFADNANEAKDTVIFPLW